MAVRWFTVSLVNTTVTVLIDLSKSTFYIPNIAENVTHIMEAGMQLDDIEPLRRHYQKTLETWTENYHAVYDKTVAERGEAFARAWDLYLQGSAASFESGNIDVIQFLMTKGAAGQGLPMSRAYMTAREN